jgi:catechol 2,3-dioxygenase-like lactoylglutathione lyase family enzyme
MGSIQLDHTIVPSRDKEQAARFFARIFGLAYEGPFGPFAPVRVNDTLTLDFDDRWKSFEPHHYAFRVSGEDFDAIFARVQAEGIAYGSTPWTRTDGKLNQRDGGRQFYFDDPDGHVLEAFTR